MNFAKFLKTPFLTGHLRWLLLNMNYVGRDMKETVKADLKEGVQEIKKYINEGKETEAILKRNGQLHLIGFYFVFNVFMN